MSQLSERPRRAGLSSDATRRPGLGVRSAQIDALNRAHERGMLTESDMTDGVRRSLLDRQWIRKVGLFYELTPSGSEAQSALGIGR
jgi:hypothetical protein